MEVVVRDTGNTGGKISSNSNANIVVKESRAKKKKKKDNKDSEKLRIKILENSNMGRPKTEIMPKCIFYKGRYVNVCLQH